MKGMWVEVSHKFAQKSPSHRSNNCLICRNLSLPNCQWLNSIKEIKLLGNRGLSQRRKSVTFQQTFLPSCASEDERRLIFLCFTLSGNKAFFLVVVVFFAVLSSVPTSKALLQRRLFRHSHPRPKVKTHYSPPAKAETHYSPQAKAKSNY